MKSPKEVLFEIVGRYKEELESHKDYTTLAVKMLQSKLGFAKANLILLRAMKELVYEAQSGKSVTDTTKINISKQFSKENKEMYLSSVSNFNNTTLWLQSITRAFNWNKLK